MSKEQFCIYRRKPSKEMHLMDEFHRVNRTNQIQYKMELNEGISL